MTWVALSTWGKVTEVQVVLPVTAGQAVTVTPGAQDVGPQGHVLDRRPQNENGSAGMQMSSQHFRMSAPPDAYRR